MPTTERSTEELKGMVETVLEGLGLTVDDWVTGEDGEIEARLGRWSVLQDDDDRGMCEGDKGELRACVVGAQEHHNERVTFYLKVDEYGDLYDVHPFDEIEPIDR